MIKYSSIDIIKRAEQLSDLENSDFISDYEKLALLNENWTMLYQKLVDANDKTFIKTIPVRNGMDLPENLYQISAIYTKQNKQYINKINASQTYGYEVKNNRLYLSKDYNGIEVEMEYYPVPETLYLRDKTTDSPWDVEPWAIWHTKYVTYLEHALFDLNGPSDHYYKLKDDVKGELALFDNAILMRYTDGTFKYLPFSSLSGNVTAIECPVIIGNELYIYDKVNKSIKSLSGMTIIENFETESPVQIIYCSENLRTIYVLYEGGVKVGNESFVLGASSLKKVMVGSSLYALLKPGQIVKITPFGMDFVKTKNVPVKFVSPSKVLTKNVASNELSLEGFIEDTILAVPNNTYFIILSYLLALSFMTKQGADTTQLSMKYAEIQQQFFNSLTNDNNASYQIRNVYKNTGSFYYGR